ncbi:hypothetical protein QVD17_20770 [Tagetes erecta]|uniref:Uncharacterized protein n=1 Tax=Tagetes erecta TaxID=13708 RepID=A0AAD8NXI9_TARER|nr:hypothetical protein QVD17_20770 [Tagetes erecta]
MAPSKGNGVKISKACKAMNRFGVSAGTVKASLKRLLKVYQNNWAYIEDDDYKVLLDDIFEPKKMEMVRHEFKLIDESEEDEDEEEEETRPFKRKSLLSGETTCSIYAASLGNVCENREELLDLDYNNTDKKARKIEDENDNDNDNDENENEDVSPSPCSSEIHIASSSNGNVKLAFSIRMPPPGFSIPNLDVVMKHVEDVYREKSQGFETGFSLAQFLKDLCQCFLEQGNVLDHVGNKIPSFDSCKEPEKQVGSANDPIKSPRFVVSSDFDHCFNGNLTKQQIVGVDELSSSKDQSTADVCSKHYWVADITRGLEKQEISVVNEVDDEKLPTFTYIHTNENYNTANVKFVLARISDDNSCPNCFGDCLSSEVPCACAVETGGEFAYTTKGSIDENFLKKSIDITLKPTKTDYFYCESCPLERIKDKKKNQSQSGSCKGHLVRKFIKECWYKCGCDFNCRNRVVQRGIQAKLQVFMTPEGKGWGLRTLENLPKGTFVCEYVGEIVTNSELFERNELNKNEQHTYPVLLDADWSSEGFLKDEEALCLDATSFGNVARFINHRCVDANMVEIPVEVESPDHHYYHHAFFTTRDVKAMEELTWDYGIDFDDDSHPVKAFVCKCGSKSCKAVKRKKRDAVGDRSNCKDKAVAVDTKAKKLLVVLRRNS